MAFVEGELAPGFGDGEFGAEGDGLHRALKGGVPEADGEEEVILVGGGGEGEAALVAFFVGFWGMGEGEVGGLACDEGEA